MLRVISVISFVAYFMITSSVIGEDTDTECPTAKEVKEALTDLVRQRKGSGTIAGLGVEIKGSVYVVEDVVGTLHLPIAQDTFSETKIRPEFSAGMLLQRGVKSRTKVCAYIQKVDEKFVAEDRTAAHNFELTYIYLSTRNP